MLINRSKKIDEETFKYYKDYGVSNLTKAHYEKRLVNNYTYSFVKVISVEEGKKLRLIFHVIPTFLDNEPIKNSAEQSTTGQYTIELQFMNVDSIVDLEDLGDMDLNEIKNTLKEIIDKCDMQFYSDDPSFYWQGFWEDLDSVGAAIYPFKGTKGDATWRTKHVATGGLLNPKFRVTKHITQLLFDLDQYLNAIAKYINSHYIEEV